MAAIVERRLAVNADDFGLSVGVNRGILEAHAAGTVTSTSLLANAPGFADAIARLRAAPRLDVGLHLNLTVGTPVAPRDEVATLWDRRTGAFYPLARLVRRALSGGITPAHLLTECTAQLQRLRAAGVAVTHLDSHRHIHAVPGIWGPVLATARAAGVVAVRIPRESGQWKGFRFSAAMKAWLIGAAWRAASRGDTGRDLHRADRFCGMVLFGAPDFSSRLLDLLDGLEPGTTELMVHPGYADRDLDGWDSYTTPREAELAALCSANVRARLARGDITLRALGQL